MKRRCVIFGAGANGLRFFAEEMAKGDFNLNQIIAFVDNDKSKQGKKVVDIPILSPEELMHFDFDIVYISVYAVAKEIERQLLGYGIPEEKICLKAIKQMEIMNSNEIIHDALTARHYMDVNEAEYENRWLDLKKLYKKIQLLWLHVGAIGEFLARYYNLFEEEIENSTLRVVIPMTDFIDGICNKTILNMIKQKIYMPDNKDISFWIYVYLNHSQELDLSDERRYLATSSKGGLTYRKEMYSSEFIVDHRLREKKLDEIGIKEDRNYICLADRERRNQFDTECDHRSFKFDVFSKTIKFLEKEGLMAIRMGKDRKKVQDMPNLLDYAGIFYSEDLDVMVMSKAKGFISPLSGIDCLAMMFGIPILTINAVAISHEAGGMRYTDCDIYIPKKYYDTTKQRYLSLKEMFELERTIRNYKEYFDVAGVELIDNTEDEIAEATEEFIKRIDGKWKDNDEDIANYMRYREIFDREANISFKAGRGSSIPFRIGSVYLRNNKYLLE